jgi:cyclophilin family peptidyl-prolyl cis-trans isomerase
MASRQAGVVRGIRTSIAALWTVAAISGIVPLTAGAGEAVPEAEEVAVLQTGMGTMVFRLLPAEAPLTVENFKRLVRDGFYDGKPFYRVVRGHVIQAGDGGENDQPTIKGEFGAHPHVVGALGLARGADPDSGSTEIYICHAVRPHLDGRYAVFGLLIEGFEVLEAIGNVEVNEKWEGEIAFHEPKKPVVIERAYLERRPVTED